MQIFFKRIIFLTNAAIEGSIKSSMAAKINLGPRCAARYENLENKRIKAKR